jgi:hypothetical protein
MKNTPYADPMDPKYRNLAYVRYADNWIIGVRGSRKDAEVLLDKVVIHLRDKLKVNLNKSKITNIFKERVMFLGTSLIKSKVSASNEKQRFARLIRMEAPLPGIIHKLKMAGFIKRERSYPKFV